MFSYRSLAVTVMPVAPERPPDYVLAPGPVKAECPGATCLGGESCEGATCLGGASCPGATCLGGASCDGATCLGSTGECLFGDSGCAGDITCANDTCIGASECTDDTGCIDTITIFVEPADDPGVAAPDEGEPPEPAEGEPDEGEPSEPYEKPSDDALAGLTLAELHRQLDGALAARS